MLTDQDTPPEAGAFVRVFGGWRGLVDSSLASTAFVAVRAVTGGIMVPSLVAIVVGLGVVALRRAHGLSLQQAWSGFFGLAVAVVVVRATGQGESFFLPGIITTGLTGVGFAVSLLVRKPLVGWALAAYDGKYRGWREHAPLRRACEIATAVWALTFFVRASVATWVYQRPGDSDGTLLIVTHGIRWPLMVGAALLTLMLVRRAGPPPLPAPQAEAAGLPLMTPPMRQGSAR